MKTHHDADRPLVVDTQVDGLLMVESRRVQPGAFWAVQQQGMRYTCTCPAGRRHRTCAHIDAAWDHRPLAVVMTEGDPFADVARFTPAGAA